MTKEYIKKLIDVHAVEFAKWYGDHAAETMPPSWPVVDKIFDEIERHRRRAEKAILDCEHAEEVANAFLATNGVIAF